MEMKAESVPRVNSAGTVHRNNQIEQERSCGDPLKLIADS